MKKILALILFLFTLCASAQEYRDVVFLKNGSVIKGFYKELFPGDTLRMETIDGGMFICPMSDVVRIAKEKTSMYIVTTKDKREPIKWRPKGYVGTFEFSKSVNVDDINLTHNSIFTTHGYALSRYLLLGAGFGLEEIQYTDDNWTSYYKQFNMPVYGAARLYFLHTRTSPYIDVRAGYTVVGFTGMYFNPSVGVAFNFTPRTGVYATVGYVMQKYKYDGVKSTSKNIEFSLGLFF